MRNTLFGAFVLSATLTLAACGGDAAQDTTGTETESGTQTETATQAAPDGEEAVDTIIEEVGFADLTGDPAAGMGEFAKCKVCHSIEEGKTGVGPSLYGVIGRQAGSAPEFDRYSDAMANSGISWSEEELYAFLGDPRGYIPGNGMAFAGINDPQQRADLIAFLKENGG